MIFKQVFIKLKDKDAGLSTEVKVAKMSMIDLAGSEKVIIDFRKPKSNYSYFLGCGNRQ